VNRSSEIQHTCAQARRFVKCQPPLPYVLPACLHFGFLNFSHHSSFSFSFFVCFLTCFFMVCHNIEVYETLKVQSLLTSLLSLSSSSTLGGAGNEEQKEKWVKKKPGGKKMLVRTLFWSGLLFRSNSCITHIARLSSFLLVANEKTQNM